MDLAWGAIDGAVGGIVVIANILGADWNFYDSARAGGWYDLGFWLGIGSTSGTTVTAVARR